MGHAFQQTIMDTLIRYQRMQGKSTLWQNRYRSRWYCNSNGC